MGATRAKQSDVARAMASVGRAVDRLVALAAVEDEATRLEAVGAIGRLGPAGVVYLISGLRRAGGTAGRGRLIEAVYRFIGEYPVTVFMAILRAAEEDEDLPGGRAMLEAVRQRSGGGHDAVPRGVAITNDVGLASIGHPPP